MCCSRSDNLRHRLIPLYNYDPTEDHDWDDTGNEEQEQNVSEPLNLYWSSVLVINGIIHLLFLLFFDRSLCTRRGSSSCQMPTEQTEKKEQCA